ncbi:Protein kinase, unclassified specificity [Sarracenia purpurea var. burkii]
MTRRYIFMEMEKPLLQVILRNLRVADAKRLCRITGKSYGLPSHHFIPVLVGFTKHSKTPCHITANADCAEIEHVVAIGIKHTILKDYRYVFPVLESNSDLLQMLESKSSETSNNKYVYTVDERRCSLVFPSKLEAAVRDGDVRDIMLATHTDTLLLKLRKGGSVEVDVKDMSFDDCTELYEGEGPSQEVLQRRRKRANKNRGDTNDWRRKIFEDKERQADYEEDTENVDLSVSIPGIIKQPITIGDQVIGFPIGAVIAPFQPLVAVTDELIDNEIHKFNTSKDTLEQILIKQLDLQAQYSDILPSVQHIPNLAKQLEALSGTENETKMEFGVKLILENGPTYVPGQFFDSPSGPTFVPGNIIETPMGPCFVAGFSVNTPEGVKFLPGRIVKDNQQPVFVAGQMAVTREGEKFVQGQMVCTKEGPKFISGQTVITSEGVKFVPGQVIQNADDQSWKFIPGQTIMTPEGPQFVFGQFTQSNEETIFIPGQAVLNENYNWEFIPGKNLKTDDGTSVFVPGKEIVNEQGVSQFCTR